jgi:hypothetical protein
MFNPCYPFTLELLEGMLAKNVTYFVRATYKRGRGNKDESRKESLIISHYKHYADAERHYKSIPFDPWRFLYNAKDPVQVQLLRDATHSKEYSIFSQFIIPGIEKKVTQRFSKQTTLYLLRHLGWPLEKWVSVKPQLYIQMGELYAQIAYQGNEIKVKFEDIENTR